ncbi:MAG: hypothetical protein JSR48_03895 [Verrucomicrobia bacterium]|nr:hypothetical protein [Verrucomicrobiota bacterium]
MTFDLGPAKFDTATDAQEETEDLGAVGYCRFRWAGRPVDESRGVVIPVRMPLLTLVPPMPGAERRFRPLVEFVHSCGWETEFVRLEWGGPQPDFDSTALFPQVDAQTAGRAVLGFSLGALYAHLGALRARHLILGSISPFFLEDDEEPRRWMISYRAGNDRTPADVLVGAKEDAQMHRRAAAVRDFYRQRTFTVVPDAEHELWHPHYLQAIKTALDRLARKQEQKPQDSGRK